MYRGLGKSIYALFVIRIINRFGDFVQLLLTLILTQKIGLSAKDAGLFVSLAVLGTMVGQMTVGRYAGRFGSKRLLVICQVMVSLSYLIGALCTTSHIHLVPYLVLLASPFRGGTAPLTNTMVADFSSEQRMAHSFSLLYLGTNVGVALGPIAASLLYSRSILLLFLISALLLFSSTMILLFEVPASTEREREVSGQLQSPKQHLPFLVWVFFLFSVIYSLTYAQNSFALPLQFTTLFGENLGATRYAALMVLNALVVIVCTMPLTAITHRLSQPSVMGLAMLMYVVGYSVYAFCSSYLLFLAATAIWTLGEILMATNTNVYLNRMCTFEQRPQANAYLHVASSLGSLASPALGGFLLHYQGFGVLWAASAALCLLLGCGYIALNNLRAR